MTKHLLTPQRRMSRHDLSPQFTGVELANFTPTESAAYAQALAETGLVPRLSDGSAVLYGHPVLVHEKAAQAMLAAATATSDVFHKNIVADPQWLHEATHTRAPILGGRLIASDAINNQFRNNVIAHGARLGFAYDCLIAFDSITGLPERKVVEIQSTVGYVGWLYTLIQAARTARPSLSKLRQAYGDPVQALRSLRKLTGGEDIIVMDTAPMTGSTSGDKRLMAQILGNKLSVPVSPLDAYRRRDGWHAKTRNARGEETGSVPLKHVLCRMLSDDIKSLDRYLANDPDAAQRIADFLLDSSVQFI